MQGEPLNVLVWVVGLVGVSLAVYFVGRAREAGSGPRNASPAAKENAWREFQESRGFCFRVGLPLALGGFGLTFLAAAIGSKSTGMLFQAFFYVGAVLAGIGFGIFGFRYRCPVCRMPPWGLRRIGRRRNLQIDPVECPSCGARLKAG